MSHSRNLAHRIAYIALAFTVVAVNSQVLPASLSDAGAVGSTGKGYFKDRSIEGRGTLASFSRCGNTQRWQKVMCSGIKDYSGDNDGFITKIKEMYGSSDSQVKLAATFIIDTMLGKSSPPSGLTEADMKDWTARVKAVNIVKKNMSAEVNTVFVKYAKDSAYDIGFISETVANKPSLVFQSKDGMHDYYVIKMSCGNPIGNIQPLPSVVSWDASGTTTVDKANAIPGSEVTFTHNIKNIGDGGETGLNWNTYQGSNKISTGKVDLTPSQNKTVVTEGYKIPGEAKPGDLYCRHVTFQNSQKNTSMESSTDACVTVTSNFDLYPNVDFGSGTSVTPIFIGGTGEATETVYNNGTAADKKSPYEIDQFVIPAGTAKPDFNGVFNKTQSLGLKTVTYAEGSYNPLGKACQNWLKPQGGFSVITGCQTLRTDTDTTFIAKTTSFEDNPINADDYSPGDMICRFVSVQNYRYDVSDANAHRISYPACVVVAKQPSLQIWGGDVRLGDAVSPAAVNSGASAVTSRFSSGGNTYGSWVEYGIFAPASGEIRSISGGGISGKAPGMPVETNMNGLTFANTSTPYGKWGPARQYGSIRQRAMAITKSIENSGADVDLAGVSTDGSVTRLMLTASKVNLHGKFKGAGTLVVMSTGDVNLSDDIALQNQTFTSIGNVTQVVIIARNITIDAKVATVDAWLVALPDGAGSGGAISTCGPIQAGDYYTGLTVSGECNQTPLQINGPVVSKELQLRRTYGATKPNFYTPAEVINMRASTFLLNGGAVQVVPGGGTPMTTMFTHELPPRF